MREICASIAGGSLDPGPISREKVWERGEDGHFRPRYRTQSSVLLRDLEDLQSFRACTDQAKTDPIIGPQLNQLLGTNIGKHQLTLEKIMRSLVGQMCLEDGSFEFHEDKFQKKWELVSRDLTETTFSHVTIAPLPLLAAPFPLRISPGIVIDRLTSEEITTCVRVGILRPQTPDFELIELDRAIGLRCTNSMKKVVGEEASAPDRGSFGQRGPIDSNSIVTDILTALRLFKQGKVLCLGEVSTHVGWLLHGGFHFRLRENRPFDTANYEIQEPEVAELQKLWHDLTVGTLDERPFLAMALRRFNMASERRQLDDRIVDLMIGAESLFLHDVGGPRDRGELRFRLAFRAAKFVESPRYSERQVFNLMRKSYDARNRVVHGGTIKDTKLPDNTTANLGDFISEIEEVMRLGIRKALTDPKIGRRDFWDDLVFDKC